MKMFDAFKRAWKYLATKLNLTIKDKGDERVLMEQVVQEHKERHERLEDQGAQLIGQRIKAAGDLDTAQDEEAKLERTTKTAAQMLEDAVAAGDTDKVQKLTVTAQSCAQKLVAARARTAAAQARVEKLTLAAQNVHRDVAKNRASLEQLMDEKRDLLAELDQAKVQETVNETMRAMSATSTSDVPTLDEVRERIKGRAAKAQGRAELNESSFDAQMMEIEHATANADADAVLAEIRASLNPTAAAATKQDQIASEG